MGAVFAYFIDQKGIGTGTHSRDVAVVAQKLGKAFGLGSEREEELYLAGLLHDLGKVVVPDKILDKEGPLSAQERNLIERHPYYTAIILDRIPELGPISVWAASHHERLDGSGYFIGCGEKHLCLESRIVAVADVYAALASDRPYRLKLSAARISAILKDMVVKGQLDGEVVEAVVSQMVYLETLLAG